MRPENIPQFKHIFSTQKTPLEPSGTLKNLYDKPSVIFQEERQTLRKNIISALAYPVFLCTLAMGVVLLFLFFMLPRIKLMMDNLGAGENTPIKMMNAIGDFITIYTPFLALILAGLALALFFYRKTQIGKNIFVVDSHALSTGQGLLVMKACDLRDEGKDAREICDVVNALRDKVNTSFIPDTLLYLYKGGRCSTLSYYGSKVLSIHPMIAMKEGQLYPKRKYIGSMLRCLKKYVADLAEEYPAYDTTRCFITHSNADEELVQSARELVASTFHFDTVLETVAGSIITSHCGRNTIGVLFISK